jgi:hypothetical protein
MFLRYSIQAMRSQGAAHGNARMLKGGNLAFHSEAFHHRLRTVIDDGSEGYNFCQTDLLEAHAQRAASLA